jgi:hemerythrin superfamily protein
MTHRMEEMASTVVGKAQAAKATFAGLTGVFRHLAEEHGKVSALLMRLKASSNPEVRRELFPTIRLELLSHEEGELKEVYPVLQGNPQTHAIAAKHEQDAQKLDKLIEELARTEPESSQWQPQLERLIEAVQHHVDTEEKEFFPEAQRVFGDRADELLERYEQAKAVLKRSLDDTLPTL